GINKSFKGIFPMNSIGYKNTNMITAGITNPQQEEFEIISKIDHNRRSYKKFVVKENRLVGFILINDIDRAGLFTGFIKNETDITPFKKYLLNDDFGFIYLPKELRKAKMLDLEVVR
ncbi:MAG TPA: NAD(P)/FAD-dependent oxidoreductase, partial [Thermoanaerobacter sp.]|nr:NAD(P)/FAD-dependent oxidoreductase [Thermoanaerobacter sp.]